MKATIDIKTPAGQSLEGFPKVINEHSCAGVILWPFDNLVNVRVESLLEDSNELSLHKGDTITIRIEEE